MVVSSSQSGGEPVSNRHWFTLSFRMKLSAEPSAPVVTSAPLLSLTPLIVPFNASFPLSAILELAETPERAHSSLPPPHPAPLFRQTLPITKQSGRLGTMLSCALVPADAAPARAVQTRVIASLRSMT